ncbi:probable proline-rich protein PRCC at C-terminar half [Coccomyxa sp. Obi]|nr:probable proline-rich protein PRCC at C-terminar half [Coccomyxa sp. Obi]
MDLLAGYGSGSDAASDQEEQQDIAQAGDVSRDPGGLLARLPPPSTSGDAARNLVVSDMPAPRRARKPVKFTIPQIPIPDSSDEEEDKPKKKVKLDTRGKRLGDVLPPPKSSSVLGGGAGPGTGARLLAVDDDDDFKDMPPSGDGVLGGPEAYAGGNEAFRVDDVGEAVAGYEGAPATDYGSYGSAAYGSYGAAPTASYAASYNGGGAYGQNGAQAGVQPSEAASGDQLLQEAMQADARGASRKNAKDPFAALGVNFVEVKQEKLKHVDPGKREAANAARTAFGPDYEARLRKEAGAQPDKLARRKHQISSLFYQSKMKELEVLETRTQGMKTKAETQAKYGW